MDNQNLKKLVKNHWEKDPCESRAGRGKKDRREFFQVIDKYRYEKSSFIFEFADFKSGKGKKVLEIGPGSGSDFVRWAQNGAMLYGRDLTEASVNLCLERLKLENLKADIKTGDVENLDFPDNFFDIVYTYGVIHHTPDTEKAVKEIYRVLKPGGMAKIMIYHSGGFTWKYQWILFALLRLKPWQSLKEIAYQYNESPGTKIYSLKEAKDLFQLFTDLKIETVVDAGDTLDFQLSNRYRNNFLIRIIKSTFFFLKYLRSYLPSFLGTTMLIQARKPVN